jgi:hypothetical protein
MEKSKKKKPEKSSDEGLQIKVKLDVARRVSGSNRVTVTVSLLDSAGNVVSQDSDFVSI